MKRAHHSQNIWPTLLAAGLVAAACSDQSKVTTAPQRPNFWAGPPPSCATGKWTGGGRIDPPNNPDFADETSGGQPPRYSDGLSPMNGKVTFGFNVFLGEDASGNCVVNKGEIQVNWHPGKINWHVSIHNGVDAFDGRPVFASTFADNSGGFCVVVGIPENFMTARENGPGATESSELTQFEGCDNDRGGSQNSRSDAMRWRSQHHGDTGLTHLTGGNIVEHGS